MIMNIDPSQYQPEEQTSFDLSLTIDEKMKLALYVGCILLGIIILFGWWRSLIVVEHLPKVIAASNITFPVNDTLVLNGV